MTKTFVTRLMVILITVATWVFGIEGGVAVWSFLPWEYAFPVDVLIAGMGIALSLLYTMEWEMS